MSDIKAGDIYKLNDDLEPPVNIEIKTVHDTGLVQTVTHIKRENKTTKRKGGQSIKALQMLLDNGSFTKINNKTNKGGN